MKTIEERAKEAYPINEYSIIVGVMIRGAYIRGAKDQKAIDYELCMSGEASDGYHTFNELYDFRREYNAALVNSGVWKAHKSYRHHSGEFCFGGGWFIVMIETPFGQISNHYENKYWNEFHCEEKELADKWDGHTEKDVIARLMKCNLKPSWKREAHINNDAEKQYKQGYHDAVEKACSWLEKELQELAMDEVKDSFIENDFKVILKSQVPDWLTDFRKAMEK